MGNDTTQLSQAAVISLLDEYLKQNLGQYIVPHLEIFVQTNEQRAREVSLMERVVRVEEELKSLRDIELMRFEHLKQELDVKFKASQERDMALQREMNARFEALQREMNARFEAVNERFEAVNTRFDAFDNRFKQMQWAMGLGFTIVSALVALFGFLTR